MPKEIFEVVRERFHLSDRTQYIVQGHWPKDAVMEAYLDQHKLKVSVKENENVSALERFKDPEKMQGIQITATVQIPENLEGYHKLVIYEKFPDKKHVWFSITAGELDKKRDKPQVYFEEESAEQGTVRIRGWAIAPKPVTVRIFDADKKPVAAEIQRTDRVDVNQLFEEAQDPGKTGFFSEITNVSGKCLYVVFYAGEKKTVHVVPLRKADILAKKLDKYVEKGIRYWKSQGAAALAEKVVTKVKNVRQGPPSYQKWIRHHLPDRNELEKQKKTSFGYRPKLSFVVPLYKTPEKYLRRLTESFQEQTYSNWELCIVNASPDNEEMQKVLAEYSAGDSRVRFCNLKENLGIAENTNRAFAMAKGEFVGLLDHDDLLAPNALYEIVKILQDHPQADALYTDEDKVTTELDEHFQPHLKPDFNLDLLRSNNYICHFFVVRKSIVEKAGGFRKEFDGAQDYDFIFRCTENAGEVLHVPEILYHWRTHKASTADNPASKMYAFEAGKRAIEAHLERTGTKGEVSHTQDLGFYRVKYPVQGKPLVSVIIPNKDEKETLQTCLEMLEKNTGYQNFEIIIVENNSTTDEIFRYYKELSGNRKIHLLRWGKEFNYSAINNFAAAHAKGEYLLFLNNDVKSINPDWLEEMLGVCQRPEVGGVGAKLIYPDNTIQHAGCVIGMGGIAGHMFVDMPADRTGYLHKASLLQDMSAVTAACLLMKKEVFEQAGGFTEELAVAFNDVDLCLKVRKNGYLIVYDPYAKLYHMESKTRGAEDSKEKVRRFQTEIEYMRCHWIDILKNGDPCYNKNLSLTKWNYSLKPIPGMETEAGQKKEKTGRKSCRKYQ